MFIPFVFITTFILYIINLIFISKKEISKFKVWKNIILVLNGAALIFNGILLYYLAVFVILLNTDTYSPARNNTTINLLFIGLVVYFLVINIVLSIFVIRKKFIPKVL
ncbi:MAG TPA: hypothetical protein VNR38_12175 [Ureibacillus sp.]|nr:hypothetical protein [Ureibacillus sp.]